MQEWLPLLTPLVVGLVGALVALITARINKRGVQENALIDQLQEEVAAARAEIREVKDTSNKKATETDAKLDASLRRERIRDDYIHELRDHIDARKPPPPPPWPEGLTR